MKHYSLAVAIFSAAWAAEAVGQDIPGVTTTIENTESASEVQALDTREQRMAVEPLDWDATRGAGLRTDAVQEAEQAQPSQQSVGTSAPGNPDSNADAEAQKDAWLSRDA